MTTFLLRGWLSDSRKNLTPASLLVFTLLVTSLALIIIPPLANAFSSFPVFGNIHSLITSDALTAENLDLCVISLVAQADDDQDWQEFTSSLNPVYRAVLFANKNSYRPEHHFDRSNADDLYHMESRAAFKNGADYVRAERLAVIADIQAGNGNGALIELGRAFHAVQDFYAHSNFVDLSPTERSQIQAALDNPDSIDPTNILQFPDLQLTAYDPNAANPEIPPSEPDSLCDTSSYPHEFCSKDSANKNNLSTLPVSDSGLCPPTGNGGCTRFEAARQQATFASEHLLDLIKSNFSTFTAVCKNNPVTTTVNIVTSHDPNDKAGSQGVGSQQYISAATPLRYAISFGNQPTATAPAQRVVITDQVDSKNDDLTALRLGPISLLGQLALPPPGLGDFSSMLDLRSVNNILVSVSTHLDITDGKLTWTFQAIDPSTGKPPADPSLGFLPPGADGTVFFTVMPRQGLPTNTQIQNQATIVFDLNAPINTPTWTNTLDATPPTSRVSALPASEASAAFTVQWSGTDVGAGIQDFTIYLSDNSGPFRPFQTNTTATSATFMGQVGHTYSFYSIARDLVGNVEIAKSAADATTQVIPDTTPPITTAAASPGPNPNGWNNANVTVTLSSTDSEANGTGVKQITFGATGAQTIASTNVSGSSTSFTISTEGITQITFFGTDNAGNVEAAKALTVRVDKTPPTVSGASIPAANANGWNNTNVTVSFQCADALSGLAAGSPPAPTILSAEGKGGSVTGACMDLASNTASATVGGINIDKTSPVVTITENPPANANGWNNSNVTVSFAAVDALSGVASVSAPVTVTNEGPDQAMTGSAVDLAGNVATGSITVNLDKTPPEAYNQFDPVAHDVVLFGRDSLSGVVPGPVVPTSVVPIDVDGDGDDMGVPDEDDVRKELRTYQVFDLAGNSLQIIEKVRRNGHHISVKILSLQYGQGALIKLGQNRQSFEWHIGVDGALRSLEQEFQAGPGREAQRVEAEFETRENQTEIRQAEPEPKIKTTKQGLDLLRMATSAGKLSIEF